LDDRNGIQAVKECANYKRSITKNEGSKSAASQQTVGLAQVNLIAKMIMISLIISVNTPCGKK